MGSEPPSPEPNRTASFYYLIPFRAALPPAFPLRLCHRLVLIAAGNKPRSEGRGRAVYPKGEVSSSSNEPNYKASFQHSRSRCCLRTSRYSVCWSYPQQSISFVINFLLPMYVFASVTDAPCTPTPFHIPRALPKDRHSFSLQQDCTLSLPWGAMRCRATYVSPCRPLTACLSPQPDKLGWFSFPVCRL